MGLTSLIQPTGSGDSGAVGEVDSITNSDGTLTISPTTGAAVASLNLGNANVWTALQTFAAGALLGSNDTLAWGDAVGGGTADTILQRDAANVLALRNGTTAQTFRIYTTFTSATNFEALEILGGDPLILTPARGSGGGVERDFRLSAGDQGRSLQFSVATDSRVWSFNGSGHFIAPGAQDVDIGAQGNAPGNIYAATSFGLRGTNSQVMSLRQLTELTTIAAAATTDTTIQIPANSLVMGVTVRVTTVIPTAATFDVGVAGATTRYGSGISTAANTTNASPGTTNPTIYASAVSVRITPNLTPADNTGRLRVTIYYLDLTAPTG